jgi:hypothetical protein
MTRSPILIFTRSQPRNLLSMARSNKRPIPNPSMLIEKKPNCPYLARVERSLHANFSVLRSKRDARPRRDQILTCPLHFSLGRDGQETNAGNRLIMADSGQSAHS